MVDEGLVEALEEKDKEKKEKKEKKDKKNKIEKKVQFDTLLIHKCRKKRRKENQ